MAAISPGPGVPGGSIGEVGTAWPMTRPDRSQKTLGWRLSVHAHDDRFLNTSAV
jgi:hypothetical protein